MERHVSTESTGTTAHARQDTPATGVRQVGLNTGARHHTPILVHTCEMLTSETSNARQPRTM